MNAEQKYRLGTVSNKLHGVRGVEGRDLELSMTIRGFEITILGLREKTFLNLIYNFKILVIDIRKRQVQNKSKNIFYL